VHWEPDAVVESLRNVSSRLFALGSAALFVRVDRTRGGPLDSEARRTILSLLEKRPAIPLAELREQLPLGWSTVWHHLRALIESGHIRLVPAGKRKIVVRVSAELSNEEARGLAVLRGASARRIAMYIHDHPEAEIRQIASVLTLSKRVVYYHVKQLHAAKLVLSTSPTRYFGLRPAPLLTALLASTRDGN
jgi:predicted transcriptional regulator